MSGSDHQSITDDAFTPDDVLAWLDAEPCPHPECSGVLHRTEYKDTPAAVCDTCAVPAVRVWGDRP